jgi:hypothetical protein
MNTDTEGQQINVIALPDQAFKNLGAFLDGNSLLKGECHTTKVIGGDQHLDCSLSLETDNAATASGNTLTKQQQNALGQFLSSTNELNGQCDTKSVSAGDQDLDCSLRLGQSNAVRSSAAVDKKTQNAFMALAAFGIGAMMVT